MEFPPDLRLFEGRYRLVQFPLQIGDSHRQCLFIEQLVAATKILDNRRTLLIFGAHGIAESAVDETGKVIHIVKIELGGGAEDQVIFAFIGDHQPDVLAAYPFQHGVQVIRQCLA